MKKEPRLLWNFHYLGYYYSPNLHSWQNDQADPTEYLQKRDLVTLLEVEEGAMYYFLLNNRFLKRAMGKGPCHAVVVWESESYLSE